MFNGRADDYPLTQPSEKLAGPTGNMRLGESVVLTGDHDGDGVLDLAAHAYRSDLAHTMAGHTFLIRRKTMDDLVDDEELAPEDTVVTPVNYPRRAAFSALVALIANNRRSICHGRITLFDNSSARSRHFGSLPLTEMVARNRNKCRRFPRHTYYDLARYVRPIGDFDSDGLNDIAMLLQADDRVSNNELNSPRYTVPSGNCNPQRNNSGSVYLQEPRRRGSRGAAIVRLLGNR